MPLTDKSKSLLSKVHPLLSEKVRQLCETLERDGLNIQVTSGLRTFAEQDALFAQGRTKPGRKVTNARGGQSNHNMGLACDLVPMPVDWDNLVPFRKIGAEAKKLGLEWGGDWPRSVDMPHVQMPNLSTKDCLRIYNANGKRLQPVWDVATSLFIKKV